MKQRHLKYIDSFYINGYQAYRGEPKEEYTEDTRTPYRVFMNFSEAVEFLRNLNPELVHNNVIKFKAPGRILKTKITKHNFMFAKYVRSIIELED